MVRKINRIIHKAKRYGWLQRPGVVLMTAAFMVLSMPYTASAENAKPLTFATPGEAVKAMVEAVKSKDIQKLEAIFGPGSDDLVSSGDSVADNARYEKFISLYEEKSRLQKESDEKVLLYVGKEDWPFPIPIIRENGLWYYDTTEGREEILARRIGRNELSAIQVCLAYVDAQREYALKDRNGNGFLEYAQKFISDPGKEDGLYWDVKAGEEQSPLGSLVAEADEKGYRMTGGTPSPFYGYYYRILTAQGKDAEGGAYDYIVKGKMIGGFALVAYPAKYGASGIMTFIVNQDGVVYQKDLGQETEANAQAIKLFNPDSTWKKVEEKDTKMIG